MTISGVLDLIFVIINIMMATLIFSLPLHYREKSLWKYILVMICIFGLVFPVCLIEDSFDSNTTALSITKNVFEIVLILGTIASLALLKKTNFKKIIFIGIVSYATVSSITNLYSFFCTFFFGPSGIMQNSAELLARFIRVGIYLLISVLVYTLIWFLLLKKYYKNGYKIFKYSIDKTIVIFYIVIFAMNLFFGTFENTGTFAYRFILIGKASFNFLMLFFIFGQANYLSLKIENTQMAFIMNKQKEQYKLAKENMEQISIKAHDLKHFAEAFGQTNMSDEQKSELEKLAKTYENIYDTGSKALDITLNEKCQKFDTNQIEYSIIADGNAISFMSDVDIYALFGNLLDNAMEACLEIEKANERVITMYLKQNGNFISLHVENTYSKPIKFVDGMPVTQKKDKINHGFGLKSIQVIVDKYHGNMQMKTENKIFNIDILFNKN